MKVQTEKLDNHIARLTVEIETGQLEGAKKKAAKRLAKRYNIPGFRKGKAPYRIIANYVGEGAILEEALEGLGNDVYKKALDESEMEPYAPAELEDFKLDPAPTFVFTFPMQPTVDLGDYKSIEVEYEPPVVEDKDVDEALRRLQEDKAVVEESASPAKEGDRITADIHGFFVDGDDEDDVTAEDDESDDEEEIVEDDDDFHNAPIHQHDAVFYVDKEREPLPGFAEALVGAEVEEKKEFELTYPDDEEKYGEFAGRTVRFVLDVHLVENVTLPELNDTFAARVTEEEEEEPLTLLELRARLRENIEKSVKEQYRSEYLDEVMEQMVEHGTFAYPEKMVTNQIDGMLQSTAQQMGVSVDDYMRLSQQGFGDLYANEDLRERASNFVKRSLVMRGILDAENIEVSGEDIDAEIDRVVSQFGEQAPMYRSLFDTAEMRENVANELLERRITDRIIAIGRGEPTDEPEIAEETSQAEDSSAEAAEPDEA